MHLYIKNSLVAVLVLSAVSLFSQAGYGFVITNDLYHRYTNDGTDKYSNSAGSAILNIAAGPKLWLGGKSFSVSAEATAGLGFLGLAIKDYKGMGTAQLPILVNLNFGGISTFDSELKQGFLIGGGIQYSRTELYGLRDKFAMDGVSRKFFQTYVVQAGYGFGIYGFACTGIVRYGFHPNTEANTLNIGIQWDVNVPNYKKIKNKASEL